MTTTPAPPRSTARPGVIRRVYNRFNPRGISNTQFAVRALSVLAVVVIGIIALSAAGIGGEFITLTYPVAAKWIIFFLNVGLLVGVLVDLVVSKRWQQPASLVVPGILLGALLVAILLFWEGWLGVATLAVLTGPLGAFVGVISGVVALALNGWLVWRIWGLGHTNPQVASQQAVVDRLRLQLTPLEDARNTADTQLTSADATKRDCQQELDDADDALKRANKRLDKKQQAFDAAHKSTLETAAKRVSDAKELVAAEEAILEKFEKRPDKVKLKLSSDPAKKAQYDAEHDALLVKVADAEDELTKAERAQKRAKTAADASTEGTALARAKSKVEAAEKAVSDAQTALGGAKADYAAKQAAFTSAEHAFTKKEKELHGAEAGLTTHQLRANGTRRGWIFGTIALFAGMAVGYLGWFGVVLSSHA